VKCKNCGREKGQARERKAKVLCQKYKCKHYMQKRKRKLYEKIGNKTIY